MNEGLGRGILRWQDIEPSMMIVGVAEDHAEHRGRKDAGREYTFRFWGHVIEVTQRKIVYEGCWEWLDGLEDCTDDDPALTGGTFTVLRGGCIWLRQLVNGPLWTRED